MTAVATGAPSTPRLLREVRLASAVDFAGFRRACRQLWAEQVAPDRVAWHCADDVEGDLFEGDPAARTLAASLAAAVPPVNAPASFLPLSESVVLHSDTDRFALLYRLLWRFQLEPGLRADPIDPDRLRADAMAQAVRRDMHKMKAFVRFRTFEPQGDEASPLHVAWFEPEHHIVEAVAPFFMRRFTQMRWAILTPERSAEWDGEALRFGPGARKQDAPPADAGEALWLTYYRHIFNPARLKLAMMQKEMPRRYWRNLPEAELISPLASQAMSRSGRMINAPATTPTRRIALRTQPAHDFDVEARPMSDSNLQLSADPVKALAQLKVSTDRCRECPIGEHATQSVFGEGPLHPALMVIGEQPGDQEDLRGHPFVGPAGKLFNRACADLGWSRDQIWVSNAVKHFKFELRGKRRIHKTPSQLEAAACLHWLESEIALVKPQALVALGATAARALLGRPVAVMKERGQWHESPRGEQVLVTLHPSALLRGDVSQQDDAYAAWLADLSLASAIAVKSRRP